MFVKNYIESKINDKIDQIFQKNSERYGIYDIKQMTHNYNNIWTQEYHCGNGFYGISTILKWYAQIDNTRIIKAPIEHGINDYENAINPYEIGLPTEYIITLSEFRKNTIERLSKKKAIVIGPYIAYAKGYYSDEEIKSMRKQNGRTLLVFPTHSTQAIDTNYDVDSFLSEIQKIRKEFDTVLACLYWKDIARGIHKHYQQQGYKIVCAGHIYDVNFLKRLHSIFDLADAVIFNQTGTGLGYAMQLQKPCYLYNQELEFSGKTSTAYLEQKYSKEHYKILELFSKADFIITEEQNQICSYVYGVGQTKTPEQLRELIFPCTF